MEEHRSAMLCLEVTTNYYSLTTERSGYGWAQVTGTNELSSHSHSHNRRKYGLVGRPSILVVTANNSKIRTKSPTF